MQSNEGLLSFMNQKPQGPASSASGGLMSATGMDGGTRAASPTVSSGGLQMAQQLSQNPTPETARQIIAQLHQMQSPEAAQFEQMIGGAMNDPQALKQLADAVIQKIGGGNA